MMRYDEAALAQRRDAAPLRPDAANKLNACLQVHFSNSPTLEFLDAMRDHIVEQISEWNDDWQPKSLQVAMTCYVLPFHLQRIFPFFLVRFGSGCHPSLQIVGGCATSRIVAETLKPHSALPLEGLKTIHPDIGATQSVQATFCQRRTFLV